MTFKKLSVFCFCLSTAAMQAFAAILGGSNHVVETYFQNSHPQTRLVSFDWDAAGNLYYSTGDEFWDVGLALYKFDGARSSRLYSDDNAFAGSHVTAIAGFIYFNDGGTYDRWTCDYFRYDPAAPAAPVNLGVLSDIWGLATWNGSDIWAAGGFPASIYRSALQPNGDLISNPLINLGSVGSAASGPLAFDAEGNLFYAEGYVSEGHPNIYRWSAAEVAAALADPEGAPLNVAGHVWATLTTGDGVTGMVVDSLGHLVLAATSFVDPSELQRLLANNSGEYAGFEVLARSDARMEMVRIRAGQVYVSTGDGIFKVKPLQTHGRPLNDFDGDGKSDMAVYDDAGGAWYAYSPAREKVIMFGHSWGWSGAQVIPGDYDGDGISDLCVYDQNTGAWYAWSQARQSIIFWNISWGWPGATPVPGDYDGDGIYDLALFDSQTGQWYIRAVEGTTLVWAMGWGWPGANPVGAVR